ncbi:MAG: hypothetical protein LBD24_01045 [Spirochaetaceae bacterium]|jgi:hypothetical protein|nr:hypothetical protein [Spirochaetaceae bacterium]
MPDITYSIIKEYGVLSEGKGGWRKEVRLISWNGKNPKIDIRDWSAGHEKMGRGVTLNKEEAVRLRDYLNAALAAGLDFSAAR